LPGCQDITATSCPVFIFSGRDLEHLQVFFVGDFVFPFFCFWLSCFFSSYPKQSVVHFQQAPKWKFHFLVFFFRGRAKKRKSREARNGCICTFYVSQQIDSAFRTFCCNVSGLEFGLGKNGERCWIRFVD